MAYADVQKLKRAEIRIGIDGEKWIFQSKDKFIIEAKNEFGEAYQDFVPKLYIPNIHFGIGFPF